MAGESPDSRAPKALKKRKRARSESPEPAANESGITELESQILDSQRHYNKIATLHRFAFQNGSKNELRHQSIIALCRIFTKLMITGNMTKVSGATTNEELIVNWLNEQYGKYRDCLLDMVRRPHRDDSWVALQLLMQLLREESHSISRSEDGLWTKGLFTRILRAIVESSSSRELCADFIETYMIAYTDIRLYTFRGLSEIAVNTSTEHVPSIMALMKYNPAYLGTLEDSQNHYVQHQAKRQATLSSPKTHRKAAAETWTSLLRGVTTKKQRKILLGLMSDGIAPWFENVEMLMDFLTDSFAVGGSTALLALSGLFYLIQEKNLDYPQFYNKLYGLVDAYILHSKHRSRFLRLLDTFLLSTHLPAALVASFIKRLSRFCLHSAPAGLVVVIPWIYNLLKNHPNCTFMIHRKFNPETDTREDPFDENEPDPMKTGAIDSSLWEIETIQSHYQPSVAAIARVISEQFTKPRYNLEDFLDHSYGSMIDAELAKELKKLVAPEYQIPRRIFTKAEDGDTPNAMLELWGFDQQGAAA